MSLWRGFDVRGARPLLAMVLVAGSLVCLGGGCRGENLGGNPLRTLDLAKFAVSFDETFETISISGQRGSGARWYTHTPWNGDFGNAQFGENGPGGPFTKLEHGLRITAHKGANGRWTSGLISSRDHDGLDPSGFQQQYGYFEIKAKLPSGDGVWPSFWLIGVDKRKSASEIDVFEYYGRFSDSYRATTHIWQGGRNDGKSMLILVPKGSLAESFNTYGVLIEADVTTFYLNRKPVGAIPTPPEYRQPFYVLADLALGGGWPIDKLVGDQTLDIEYIRVYRPIPPRLP